MQRLQHKFYVIYCEFISGDLIDSESCVNERMDYRGNTTISLCLQWIDIFHQMESGSAVQRDVFQLDNFHGDTIENLGSKCR